MLATLAKLLAGNALAMLMLSVALRTDRNVMVGLRDRWPTLLRALAVVWLVVPAITLVTILTLRPSPLASATLMTMAICPGLPLSLRKSKQTGGDALLSLQILIATSITAVLMVPLWSAAISHFTPLALGLGPGRVAALLVPMIVLPLLVGYIINRVSPGAAAVLAKVATVLFVVGFLILAVVVVSKSLPMLRELTAKGLFAAIIVAVGSAVAGYLAGGPRRPQRISVAYVAALGNPALAIAALASAPLMATEALPLVGAFVILRALALLPFALVLKKQKG